MSPYESHKPVLEYALRQQGRHVLEIGGGHCSTPLIHSLAEASITLENDWKWYEEIKRYGYANQAVLFSRDLIQDVHLLSQLHDFSLAFVDSNIWEERCQLVKVLKGNAEVILLHDSLPEHLNRCREQGFSIPQFIYSFNYCPPDGGPEAPPTLILSDKVDVRKWGEDLTK